MHILNEKLSFLSEKIESGKKIKIAILGLGSVGGYLLNYLNSWDFEDVEIYIGFREIEKTIKNVNISKVSAIIRNGKSKDIFLKKVDLDNVQDICTFIEEISPDFIVNTSRVYSGLKYGSISWDNIRAYGLWAPLSIRFIKNIMQAHEDSKSKAIVINTSYSDAVIPWLKSAGMHYPDFGSGNLNHLIPRIKMALAEELKIEDIENIYITLATSHFHDVVISKEGQTEGIDPLIHISYQGKEVNIDMTKIWEKCAITMPNDAQRNMMNASSNFEIIKKIILSAIHKSTQIIHSPGVGGYIGGYPIAINFAENPPAKFDENYFSLAEMIENNRKSIYLDGIEKISEGVLFYTDELIKKVNKAFNVEIPKCVNFLEIKKTADFIIENIIEKQMDK